MVAGRALRWIGLIIGFILLGVVLSVLFIYSGLYSVAATYPDPAPVEWVLSTTMDNSVKRHARAIKVPPLDDPAMVQAGVGHYQKDCVFCHGAPGVEVGEVAKGLNPSPPELVEAAGDWKPGELFWITKYGVRMSGMPAWGPTHTDRELWHIVAFLRKISSMSSAEYQKLSGQAPEAKAK